MNNPRIAVIGAGVGGLTTAAILAKAGLDVTVLEAHVYPGGCAGTFFHKGYRFDAGATLAGGFYPGGPMDIVAQRAGVSAWPSEPSDPAMTVHLPDGTRIPRYGDERRHQARQDVFGPATDGFWQWQEATADALWGLALRTPAWPPQTARELAGLGVTGTSWLARQLVSGPRNSLVADAFRPLGAHLHDAPTSLRLFVDAQLLIAAQTTSSRANALYGASALDLPRRGVVHLRGGIGAIGDCLAAAVRRHGGDVLYRKEVTRIVMKQGRPVAVETKRGERFSADLIIANLPPWNIAKLLGEDAPPRLKKLPPRPPDGWGAFMVYAGVDKASIPADTPYHHQVVIREPMGEANTVFVSISPPWDEGRAPAGQRAVTISTHTGLQPWWTLFEQDRNRYEARRDVYTQRMVEAVEHALPGFRAGLRMTMSGTPVTFQRFTRRALGWVGGFPQIDLFRTWAPRLGPALWMVGDSIFPGQSTAAVALGGIRVAEAVLAHAGQPAQASKPALTVISDA